MVTTATNMSGTRAGRHSNGRPASEGRPGAVGWSRLALAATLLALTVAVFGAYVRLSDAGLSCPDWPGCYGQLLVPDTDDEISAANAAFPERAVDVRRAWKEMVHRYLAGVLGLCVLFLAAWSLRRRRDPHQPLLAPWLLLAVVVFQAALGMWTVTLQVKPVIVMAHLLGGFATVALLAWISLRSTRWLTPAGTPGTSAAVPWIAVGVAVLCAQVALGGWTSANYAALACPDFPRCQGQWLPPLDFAEALRPWRGTGQNYEGGVLANDARVTVHLLHRLGAIVAFIYLAGLGIAIARTTRGPLAAGGAVLAAVVTVQVLLGVGNVVLHLPIGVAAAHNAVAACLLIVLVVLVHIARPPTPRPGPAPP